MMFIFTHTARVLSDGFPGLAAGRTGSRVGEQPWNSVAGHPRAGADRPGQPPPGGRTYPESLPICFTSAEPRHMLGDENNPGLAEEY